MVLNTAVVSLAVAPTIVSTLVAHVVHRAPRRHLPTAHLAYDQGLHLVRAFLDLASHHTIEEVQAFMAQRVPAPTWIRLETVVVPDTALARAADALADQLGPDGLRRVGGRRWWQWRPPRSGPLEAEWIEMRADYAARKKRDEPVSRRVLFYVHGGAYFMGSVDTHRYQLQRHARKLKARVFAPRYRLAPQFPFPCGLHDCLAAYLHLLDLQGQDPRTIVVAGDSAGGGMVLSLLVALRDRGLPLPAGAILISPWADLTHSFPSLAADDVPLDYIPPQGFHFRPSEAWPPPTGDELRKLVQAQREKLASSRGSGSEQPAHEHEHERERERERLDVAQAAEDEAKITAAAANRLTVLHDDGRKETVEVDEQIQLYAPNTLMDHPLVSPVLQPTLGGLPPMLVTVGGGEILRDEQMYLAHKAADPARYPPPPRDAHTAADKAEIARQIALYPPTDVQLQVWDDLCHVAPTLSFTRPAKFMFRAIAQFGAWALARAQATDNDRPADDDDAVSIVSNSSSESDAPPTSAPPTGAKLGEVGHAGDPLPPFQNHMIRQRVTRHGDIYALAPAMELPGPRLGLEHPERIGVPKPRTVNKWLAVKAEWDRRYAQDRARAHKAWFDACVGGAAAQSDGGGSGGRLVSTTFGPGEHPPPSAMAGRFRMDMGGKGDDGGPASGRRPPKQNPALALWALLGSKHDELTVERAGEKQRRADGPATVAMVGGAKAADDGDGGGGGRLAVDTGATGKRPFLGGIALPFSLNRPATTASMVTLQSSEGREGAEGNGGRGEEERPQ